MQDEVTVTQAEELFDAIYSDMASYAEWGIPSYREASLQTINEAFARHRHQAKRDTRGRMEWRDIESAPKACHVLAARFNEDCGEWQMQVTLSPPIYPFTHWMPLPPAPTPQEARHADQ